MIDMPITWVIHKDKNKFTHQLSMGKLNLKVNHHTGGRWFIHGPTHCKE